MYDVLPLIGLMLLTLVLSFGAAEAQAAGVPRPEHPEPLAERAEWLNLNGEWEFAETDEDETKRYLGPEPYPLKIHVPFCRESELSGLGHKGFVKNVWYRRTFTKPAEWTSPRVRLHIGACDWRTRVWINGVLAGQHTGGSVRFSFDITALIHSGENTLIVHAFDDTASGLQALGKQSTRLESHGIFYTRTTGIWQTVWLEGAGATYIREYALDPDPARERALLNIILDGPLTGLTLEASALSGDQTAGSVSQQAEWRNNLLVLPVPEPRLWSVEDPYLYGLELKVMRGAEVVDRLRGYFGMRRVTIDGAAILINDKPVFQRLVLDQGFYPDGIWTAPTDDALRRDIELSQAAGFNGARLHQKVFEPRFLYWADRLGYLVWGEFPSFGANYENLAVNAPIIGEWAEIVQRDRNHAAIIGWCPFNETPPAAGELQSVVVALTRRLDPSRPVIETSGWTHTIDNPELLDAHDYNQDPPSFRARWTEGFDWGVRVRIPARYGLTQSPNLPFFVSEYGGIGWDVDPGGWGYGNNPKSLEEFYARFKGLADALLDSRHHFGLCYTQLTNVEQEQNGVYAYDRSLKFDVAPLKAALSREAAYEKNPPRGGEYARPIEWRLLVGALQDGPQAKPWRHAEKNPGEDWNSPDFDASRWEEGYAPFGKKEGEWQQKIRSPWTSSRLWLRQEFEYDGAPLDVAALVLHHDDDTEVYVNGTLVWKRGRWLDSYEAFDVTEALRGGLKPGRNVIAVQVSQDYGGQYLDLALLAGNWSN